MKKVETQVLISNYLSTNPISLIDLLGKTVTIKSYETFITELTMITKTFNKIVEFCTETQKHLDKMEKLIVACETFDEKSTINYISSNLKRELCGYSNSSIRINALSIHSITNTGECSEKAFQLIYSELGFDKLNDYINLIKNPSSLTSYLNSNNTQNVAMHYILFKTNHHSNSKFQRDFTTKNLYEMMATNINTTLSEITSEKEDYITFMNSEKESYKKWINESDERISQLYENSKQEYTTFLADSKNSIEQIKQTYSAELKLKEPSKFMEEKSIDYKSASIRWALATIGLSIVLLILLYLILDPSIEFTKKIITIKLFSNQMPVYSSIIIFSMIALIIYVIKLFIKMTISSKHLSEEYHQKYVLTYFYLSLLNDGKLDEKQANVILATLFAKADTGLIKNDNSSETELITKMFSLMK